MQKVMGTLLALLPCVITMSCASFTKWLFEPSPDRQPESFTMTDIPGQFIDTTGKEKYEVVPPFRITNRVVTAGTIETVITWAQGHGYDFGDTDSFKKKIMNGKTTYREDSEGKRHPSTTYYSRMLKNDVYGRTFCNSLSEWLGKEPVYYVLSNEGLSVRRSISASAGSEDILLRNTSGCCIPPDRFIVAALNDIGYRRVLAGNRTRLLLSDGQATIFQRSSNSGDVSAMFYPAISFQESYRDSDREIQYIDSLYFICLIPLELDNGEEE